MADIDARKKALQELAFRTPFTPPNDKGKTPTAKPVGTPQVLTGAPAQPDTLKSLAAQFNSRRH